MVEAGVAAPSSPAPACPNCGSSLLSVYCAACGERQPSHVDTTMRHFVREAYDELVSVDGRVWRSIVALLSRPGFLAHEYFSGRRTRYMRPVSLFILLNLLLFVAQPHTGLFRYSYADYTGNDGFRAMANAKQAGTGMSDAAFETRFDAVLGNQKKSMLLVAIPLFALMLLVLHAGSGRTYVEHLVFSVHAYAFMIFYLLAVSTVLMYVTFQALLAVGVPMGVLKAMSTEAGLVAALGLGMVAYLALGERRFYGASRPAAFARAGILFFTQLALIVTFRTGLFHTVLLGI